MSWIVIIEAAITRSVVFSMSVFIVALIWATRRMATSRVDSILSWSSFASAGAIDDERAPKTYCPPALRLQSIRYASHWIVLS